MLGGCLMVLRRPKPGLLCMQYMSSSSLKRFFQSFLLKICSRIPLIFAFLGWGEGHTWQCLGSTWLCTQELLVVLGGTIRDVGDWTRVGCLQSKQPTHCTITLVPRIASILNRLMRLTTIKKNEIKLIISQNWGLHYIKKAPAGSPGVTRRNPENSEQS